MSADNLEVLQNYVILFAIIGGIITVGTALWRIINFVRMENKESITAEHNFNVEQHHETREVVKDGLANVESKFSEVKTEVARISDLRVDVAVTKERLDKHEDAIEYLRKKTNNNG